MTVHGSDREGAGSTDQPIPLPSIIASGGRRGWVAALAAGTMFGAVTLVVPALLDEDDAFGFLSILLGMIGAVYLGFVLMDGRAREFRIEYAGFVLFAALATVALTTGSALVLAGGFIGHALWDGLHRDRGIHTAIPWWYVPLCLGFDVVVGAYVLIRFL